MSETPHVLVVEDDPKLSVLVSQFLQSHGFVVSVEKDGAVAEKRILAERPDVVVLDIMLPGLDGLQICRRVRDQYEGSILMLTARGDDVDEVVGLEIGADDYLAKPVRPRVLLARIRSLLRRSTASPPAAGTGRRIQVGSLVIDAGNRIATLDGEPIDLTTAEYDLLWVLASHAGEVLTREQLYTELRGIAYDGLDRSIDLRISRLRKKLGEGKQPARLKSVRGTGYMLVADP